MCASHITMADAEWCAVLCCGVLGRAGAGGEGRSQHAGPRGEHQGRAPEPFFLRKTGGRRPGCPLFQIFYSTACRAIRIFLAGGDSIDSKRSD